MIRSLVDRLLPLGLDDVARRLASLRHAGDAVSCEVCGGSFSRFLPAGSPVRPQARCPGCGSLERHRLVWRHLRSRTSIFTRPMRLLHVAPEPALRRALERLPALDYVAVDLESPLADVRVDLTAMPFADGVFDGILCSHVLEHIPDDRAAMRELRRTLAPDGWAILEVPIDEARERTYEDWTITAPAERVRAFGQRDHVRWYGRDYPDRLREAGFDVVEDRLAASLEESERARLGIELQSLHLCRRAGPRMR